MKHHTRRLIVTAAVVWSAVLAANAQEQLGEPAGHEHTAKSTEPGSLHSRVEIDHRVDFFKATVFLRNATASAVTVEHNCPIFTCKGMSVRPPKSAFVRRPMGEPRRQRLHMTVPAGVELPFGEYIIPYPQLRPGPYEMHVRLALGTRNQDMVDTKVDLRIPEPRAAARRERESGAEEPGSAGALRGRLEISHRDDTFKARVFLKNTTETGVTFTVSSHGVPKAIVPTFTCEGRSYCPAKFRHPSYCWKPLRMTIPAGKERFYDEYLLPYPTLRPGTYKLKATMRFPWVGGPLVTRDEEPNRKQTVPRRLFFLDMTTQLRIPEAAKRQTVEAPKQSAEPAEKVAVVRTLEELSERQPLKLSTGWQVRLGLSDGGKAAGPWRLLYCLAKHADADQEWRVMRHDGESYGKRLGPVFFQVTAQSNRDTRQHAAHTAELFRLPREGLYCAFIPTTWKGEYHVTVRSPKGTVIGVARFEVEQPAVCYWQPFAERHPNEASSVHYGVVSRAHAALPKFGELSAIWRPSANVEHAAPRDGTPLPGKIPVEAPWSDLMRRRATSLREGQAPPPLLRLALRGDTFVVESDVPMVAWPDLHLLVRWWVNGEPVIPSRTDRIEAISIGRALKYAQHLTVAFGLPENLGPLEASDRVGIQVLYSPAFVQTLPKSRAGDMLMLASLADRSNRATVPLLSNRIEFEVTEGMVKNRETTLGGDGR